MAPLCREARGQRYRAAVLRLEMRMINNCTNPDVKLSKAAKAYTVSSKLLVCRYLDA